MATITELTVVPESEITDRATFDLVVKCFTNAGFPSDPSCCHPINRFNRPYFGVGNISIGWVTLDWKDGLQRTTVAELVAADNSGVRGL